MSGIVMSSATFSDDRLYRYDLQRRFEVWPETSYRPLLFVMLNPSTADESVSDPTVTRCVGYARRWGYEGVTVCNLFALRATRPVHLYKAENPGDDAVNDLTLAYHAKESGLIVCAWGTHGKLRGRAEAVLDILREQHRGNLYALHINGDGSPKHPLYCRGDIELVKYGGRPS